MNRLIQSLTDAAKHVKLPHRKPKEEVPTFYEDAPKPKKSKKGMKGVSTEKSSRAKKLVVVNLVGIGFLGGLFLYTHMDDRPDAKPNPQQTATQSAKKTLPPLNLAACGRLEFYEPDTERFPCVALAYRALRAGGTMPAVQPTAAKTLARRPCVMPAEIVNTTPVPGIRTTMSEVMRNSMPMALEPLRCGMKWRGPQHPPTPASTS